MKLHEMDERMRRLHRDAAMGDPDAVERLEQARFQGGNCSHMPGIRDVKVSEDWTYHDESGMHGASDDVDHTTFTATCKRCGEELERESIWEDPHYAKPPAWVSEDPNFRAGTLTRAYKEYTDDLHKEVLASRNISYGKEEEEDSEQHEDYLRQDFDDYYEYASGDE